MTAFEGEEVLLSETLGSSNVGTYTSALACTGGGTLSGNTLTIGSTGADITCTYTNTGSTADLAITKTDGVAAVVVGGSTSYTIRVTNNGPDTATGAILKDPAVTGLSKTAVTCSSTPGLCVTAPTVAQLESGSFALPALADGKFYEITVTASVTATGK